MEETVFSKEAVQRECPFCMAVIDLPKGTMDGEILPCSSCGQSWEVVSNPATVKQMVAQKGNKGEENVAREYNELLRGYQDREELWVLLPEPYLEEDSGE